MAFADLLEGKGDLIGARKVLAEAVVMMPERPRLHARLGRVHYLLGDNERAVAEYSAAIRQKPDAKSTVYMRGRALRALRRFAEARIDFERVIELEPAADAYRELAMMCYELRDWIGAQAAFESLRELSPEMLATVQKQYARAQVRAERLRQRKS